MKVRLMLADVGEVAADALVVPVDGVVCRLGGAVARAILKSVPREERLELREDIDAELDGWKPIPDGDARALEGRGRWARFIVAAVILHPTAERPANLARAESVLRAGVENVIAVASQSGIASMAITVVGDTRKVIGDAGGHRLDTTASIRAIATALKTRHDYPGEVFWCFVDRDKRDLAVRACDAHGVAAVVSPA